MICALIMAGGRGTRFYPASTENKPKQFLSLVGENTMIQDTVKRLDPIIPINQIFIATCSDYVDIVKTQIPSLPMDNIIVEPVGRNTAPCVLLSAMHIQKKFEDATMLVIPSDSLISNNEEYINVIKDSNQFINDNRDSVVTIGIIPTRPETGYGYIKTTKNIVEINKRNIIKVEKFVEKPNMELAQEYFQDGNYLWNAGMFMWKVNYVIELGKLHMKDTYKKLSGFINLSGDEYQKKLFNIYPTVDKISVDYALMEKIDSINVVEGTFGWDDLGSWNALERYLPKDQDNNSKKGDFISYKSSNNISYSTHKKIRMIGIDNVFCIETDDEIVIGNKEYLSKLHEISKLEVDEFNN